MTEKMLIGAGVGAVDSGSKLAACRRWIVVVDRQGYCEGGGATDKETGNQPLFTFGHSGVPIDIHRLDTERLSGIAVLPRSPGDGSCDDDFVIYEAMGVSAGEHIFNIFVGCEVVDSIFNTDETDTGEIILACTRLHGEIEGASRMDIGHQNTMLIGDTKTSAECCDLDGVARHDGDDAARVGLIRGYADNAVSLELKRIGRRNLSLSLLKDEVVAIEGSARIGGQGNLRAFIQSQVR